ARQHLHHRVAAHRERARGAAGIQEPSDGVPRTQRCRLDPRRRRQRGRRRHARGGAPVERPPRGHRLRRPVGAHAARRVRARARVARYRPPRHGWLRARREVPRASAVGLAPARCADRLRAAVGSRARQSRRIRHAPRQTPRPERARGARRASARPTRPGRVPPVAREERAIPSDSRAEPRPVRATDGPAPVQRFVSAFTPGSTLPSRYSSEAPPPVETWETLLDTPAFFTADAESPPPMMVVAPCSVARARISAMEIVPLAVASISNTPTGPFQRIVFAPSSTCSNAFTDSGPMSTA